MKKMMSYKEANTVLGSSLSPDQYCICKQTATNNGAAEFTGTYASFAYNRLVPAEAVSKITYTIRFLDWDGTVLKTETVTSGNTPTLPSDPTRTGYTFSGWSPAVGTASANQDYTATYTKDTVYYTIRFLDYDGTVLQTYSVAEGSTPPTPSDPSRSGYTFSGWSPSLGSATKNQDYTATYTKDTVYYTITFEDYDGTVISTQSVAEGSYPSTPSDPSRDGYTFDGWYPSISTASSNTTYTATYTEDAPVFTLGTFYAKSIDNEYYESGSTIAYSTDAQFQWYFETNGVAEPQQYVYVGTWGTTGETDWGHGYVMNLPTDGETYVYEVSVHNGYPATSSNKIGGGYWYIYKA